MADAQRRAVENHRRRLRERGLDRFEVRGLEADKSLLRAVARRLAEEGPAAGELRSVIQSRVDAPSSDTGGILRALRRSPLVGADIDLSREIVEPRDIDL